MKEIYMFKAYWTIPHVSIGTGTGIFSDVGEAVAASVVH
jgi:hypothetical protein